MALTPAEKMRRHRERKRGKAVTVTPDGNGNGNAVTLPALASSSPAPAREKKCNLPEPRKRRTPLCPPAPREAYERAKALLAVGRSYADVKDATGQTHLSLNEAAMAYDDFEAWKDAQDRHKAAMAARIAAAALAAGENGVKRKVVRKTVNGVVAEETVTEEHGTDAALLRVAGEYTDPERFGRLARAGEGGKGASVNVQVVGTVVLARPEPLDED